MTPEDFLPMLGKFIRIVYPLTAPQRWTAGRLIGVAHMPHDDPEFHVVYLQLEGESEYLDFRFDRLDRYRFEVLP